MNNSKPDYFGTTLLITFFALLTYAGYLAYQSIDWTILQRLESTKLILPTPISTPTIATPSATPNH